MGRAGGEAKGWAGVEFKPSYFFGQDCLRLDRKCGNPGLGKQGEFGEAGGCRAGHWSIRGSHNQFR